jgi:hypothetical protein
MTSGSCPKETERQFRVLRQSLEMHSMLKDKYARRAKVSQILLLACSSIFVATRFSDDSLFLTLDISPDVGRVAVGIASVLAFITSLALLVQQWEGHARKHEDSAKQWSRALAEYRRFRCEDGTWPDDARNRLDAAYWTAAEASSPIPPREFNSLKAKHLMKTRVSDMKSRYPACPMWILKLKLAFADTGNAICRARVMEADRGGAHDGEEDAAEDGG